MSQPLAGQSGNMIAAFGQVATKTDVLDATGAVEEDIGDIYDELDGFGTNLDLLDGRVTVLETAPTVSTFNAAGAYSFYVPTTAKFLDWEGIGGGGGGRRPQAATGNAVDGGYGGGQGGYVRYRFQGAELAPLKGQTLTGSVGTGGNGATSDATNGAAGGNTTLVGPSGTLYTAVGGPGGNTAGPNTGAGTEPQWEANGGNGQGGSTSSNPTTGPGGNGYMAQGAAVPAGAGAAGNDGVSPPNWPTGGFGPGSGGSGGNRSNTGGGAGGHGAIPGGGGAGGGTFAIGGFVGSGGNGARGAARATIGYS